MEPLKRIKKKTEDWFGTNFASPEEIISESSVSRITARYYDDATSDYTRRIYFDHDMVIELDQYSMVVQLWISNRKDSKKTAGSYFYNKNGQVKSSNEKQLGQLMTKGEFFMSELEDYLRTN